jgi:CDP-4-dehydro-6-deoxyglucose reductase, E1
MTSSSIDKEITKFVNTINQLDKKQSSKKTKIQYAGMVFDNEEIQTAIKSLLSSFSNNWFALGKNALLFQNKLASYLQVDQSVFVNSGSSANLISIATLDAKKIIKRGDEVITMSTTFPTTINPLLLYGLKPVLIDTELASFTANLEHLEKAITDKTKLIMIPHINGSPNDMKRIMEIAQKNDLAVVEDACDALGSKFDGKLAGTFGDMGTFSFYAAHHMSTGEGGAVVGNSEFLSTAESLRDWGRVNIDSNSFGNRTFSSQKISKKLPEDYEERYSYSNIGYNLKPLDMQAAIGLIQLKKLKKFTQKRKQNFKFLFENLQNFSDDLILPQSLPDADPSWFVFPITVKQTSKHKRSNLIKFLEKQGIETRPILAGNISSHPAYDKIKFRKFGKLNNSELILNNSFFVGVYPGLDDTSLEYIVKCFKDFFKNY